jgi:hypothetical protein
MDPSTFQKPKKLPQLDPSHYGIILSGPAADAENHLCALKSPFYEGFSEEKNKEAWEKCGAVPLTRRVLQHPSVRIEIESEEQQEGELPMMWTFHIRRQL